MYYYPVDEITTTTASGEQTLKVGDAVWVESDNGEQYAKIAKIEDNGFDVRVQVRGSFESYSLCDGDKVDARYVRLA